MSDPYVGEIRLIGFNFAPQGWAFCNGSQLSIKSYPNLFSLIRTTYGGDGTYNFALPDLRGRLPLNQGGGYGLGGLGGSETVTLTAPQLAPHTHALQGSIGGAVATGPTGGYLASNPNQPVFTTDTANLAPLDGSATGGSGGGQAHDNMMPFLTLNFIIALDGIFPPQP